MAVITRTIGSAGRQFTNIGNWEAAGYDATASDDAVGECYADSALPGATLDTSGPLSILLKPASGEEHDGTEGTGVVMGSLSVSHVASGDTTVIGLESNRGGAVGALSYPTSGGSSYGKRILSRMIFRDFAWNSGNGTIINFDSQSFSDPWTYVTNCVFYELYGNAGSSKATHFVSTGKQVEFQACIVHDHYGNSVNRGVSNTYLTVRNIICTDTEADFYSSSKSTSASSDATGTTGLINLSSADLYTSNVRGAIDLNPKAGATTIDAGTDLGTSPDYVQFDMLNRDRDTEGDTWDVGAFEYVAAGGTTTTAGGTTTTTYGGVEYDVAVGEGGKHSDSGASITALLDAVGDGGSHGDSLTSTVVFFDSVSDGSNHGDSVSAAVAFLDSFSDGGVHSDTVSGSVISLVSVSFSEGASAGDSSSSLAAFQPSTVEGAKHSDSASSTGQFGSTIGDGALHGDSDSGSIAISLSISDSALSGDSHALDLTINATVSDQVNAGDTLSSIATFLTGVQFGSVAADTVSTAGGVPSYTYTLDLPDGSNVVQNAVNVGMRELFNQTGVTATYSAPGVAVITLPVVVLPADADDFGLGGQYTTRIHHDVLVQASHLDIIGGPARGHLIEVDLNGDGSSKTLQVAAPFDSMRVSKHFTRQGTMLRISTFLEAEERAS